MAILQRLGKYEIRREIGKGSMGVVYEGWDPQIQRRVAIKVVRDDELDRSQLPELLQRLKREAQAAGRLNHPGIVSVYDYGEDNTLHGTQVAFIAMEFVDGGDLKAFLESGQPFAMPEVARWMGGILHALQHAHERGVTHRDIKPGNVMLLPDGTIKIADFGVARLENSELTRTGSMIGTPQYMAPEQLLGLQVDGRADLFACGVILYQLLTGNRPFSGSYATVVQKVLNEEPPPPTTLNRTLAPAWDLVVRTAMAKKPEDRYASAREFAAAVAQTSSARVDEDATVVLPVPARARAPTMASSPAPAPAPAPRSVPEAAATEPPAGKPFAAKPFPAESLAAKPIAAPRSSNKPVLVLGAAAAGVAALVGGLLWRSAPPEPQVVASPGAASTAVAAAPVAAPVAQSAAQSAAPPVVPPVAPAPAPAPAPKPSAAPSPAGPPSRPATTVAKAPAAAEPLQPSPSPAPMSPLAPPLPPYAADWQARRDLLQTHRARLALPAALALLLDLKREEDQQKVLAIESYVRQQGPHMAAVLGVVNGHLAFAWRSGTAVEQAREAALGRCRELRASGCAVVMADGELRKAALVEVAGGLGTQSVADVRSVFMRSVSAALDRAAAAQAAATAKPAPPASAIEKPPPAVPEAPRVAIAPSVSTSASEWAEAQAALRAGAGRAGLASALSTLLAVRRNDEREVLDRFEKMIKRLPWKSALAMGERNGHVVYGWAQREARVEWAADAAINACARAGSSNCAVVMADGKVNEAGILALAGRLGARQQEVTRDALLHSMQKLR